MTVNKNYHEVDSTQKGETFDEARYYEGDQFELGGVDFGYSDTRLQDEIKEILVSDPDILATDVMIEVSNEGVVTLTGAVADKKAKDLAQSRVEKVSGVKGIENELHYSDSLPLEGRRRVLEEEQRFKMI